MAINRNRISATDRVHLCPQEDACRNGVGSKRPRTGLGVTSAHLNLIMLILVVVYCSVFASAIRGRDGNFFDGTWLAIGPDFAVLDAAGGIVAAGNGGGLYDARRQEAEQTRVLGGVRQSFGHFFYPPWVAAPYAVLVRLPYLAAYFIAAIAMALLLVPIVWLMRDVSETVHNDPVLVGMTLAAFWPLFWSITDGQNTLLSMLCLVGVYRELRRAREGRAGAWLGCLLSKPQMVVLILPLLVWQRKWRTVVVAFAVGLGFVVIGVALAGPGWPAHLLSYTTGPAYHAEVDAAGEYQMSVPGVVALFFGAASRWSTGAAVVLVTVGFVLIGYFWRDVRYRSPAFPLQFGLAVAVTLAVSPHALHYDSPLLVIPILAVVDRWHQEAPSAVALTRRRKLFLVGLFVAGFTWQFSAVTGVQPLAILPIVVGAYVARLLMSDRQAAESASLLGERAGAAAVKGTVAA
jgi:hypothetical protein